MKKDHRISILGGPGSGKSTLAKKLSKSLGVPVFHLDRELLDEKYNTKNEKETHRIHDKIIQKASWVIDGNYSKIFEERLQRATLIVYINAGRAKTIPRVLRRNRVTEKNTDTVPEGANCDRMTLKFSLYILKNRQKKKLKKVKGLCIGAETDLLVLKSKSVDKMVEEVLEKLIW